jgi:hypothetical protein
MSNNSKRLDPNFVTGFAYGEGCFSISIAKRPGPNHVKVRMIISIKNLRANVIMLLLVQEVLGGTVRIERKAQYVSWIAISKNLIQSLIKLLEKYPLLTTRKQCQLKFAIKCIEHNTRSFVVENRDFMYDDQHNMLNYNDKNFVIPEGEENFIFHPLSHHLFS